MSNKWMIALFIAAGIGIIILEWKLTLAIAQF
jgi:hypothetical protein